MKKLFIVFVTFFALIAFTGLAIAEDLQVAFPIERVLVKKDKAGNPYCRILVQNTKELNGVIYSSTASVMAFGDQVTAASRLKKGDTLKAIVARSEFRGGVSYQLLKITP